MNFPITPSNKKTGTKKKQQQQQQNKTESKGIGEKGMILRGGIKKKSPRKIIILFLKWKENTRIITKGTKGGDKL